MDTPVIPPVAVETDGHVRARAALASLRATVEAMPVEYRHAHVCFTIGRSYTTLNELKKTIKSENKRAALLDYYCITVYIELLKEFELSLRHQA